MKRVVSSFNDNRKVGRYDVDLIAVHCSLWLEFSGEVIFTFIAGIPKSFIYIRTFPNFSKDVLELNAYTPFVKKCENSLSLQLRWTFTRGACIVYGYELYREGLRWTTYNQDQLDFNIKITSIIIPQDSGGYYYLIIPKNNTYEYSYGLDSLIIECLKRKMHHMSTRIK